MPSGDFRLCQYLDTKAYRPAKVKARLLLSATEQVPLLPMEQTSRLSMAFAMTVTSLEAYLTELRRDVFTKAGAMPISALPRLKHGQRVKIKGRLRCGSAYQRRQVLLHS